MDCDKFLGGLTPLEKFKEWFEEAKKTSLRDPNAVMVSTLGDDGFPHTRVVLMKDIHPEGLVFYSNYESQKGADIQHDNHVALHFYWDPMFRQVAWRGLVEKIPYAESAKYWDSRPRLSQVSQWTSKQSMPLKSREDLEAALKKTETEFDGKPIPCPSHWGGYLFKPTYVEFWIGRENRSHDRFTYRKVENNWNGQRLYP